MTETAAAEPVRRRFIYQVTTGFFRGMTITRWDYTRETADRLAAMEGEMLSGKVKFVREL